MIYSDFAHPYLKDFKERIEDAGYYTLEFSQSANLNRFLKFMDWAKPDSRYALYPLKKNMNMGRGTTGLGLGEYGRMVPLELQFDDWTYSGMRLGINDDVTQNGDGENRYAYLDFTKLPLNTKYGVTVLYLLKHAVPEGIQNYYFNSATYHLAHDTYFCSDGSDQNYSIIAPYWSLNLYRAQEGYTTLHDDRLGTELKGIQLQTVKNYDGDFNQRDLWNQADLRSNGDDIFCISFNSWGAEKTSTTTDVPIYRFDDSGNVKIEYIPSGTWQGTAGPSTVLISGAQSNINEEFNRPGSTYQLKTHSGSNARISWPWQVPASNILEPFRLNFGLQQDLYQINTRYDGAKTPGLRHWAYAILVMSGSTDPDRVDLISELMLENLGFNSGEDLTYKKSTEDYLELNSSLSGFSSWGEIRTGESISAASSLSEFEQLLVIKKTEKQENILLSGSLSDFIQSLIVVPTGYSGEVINLSGSLSSFVYVAGTDINGLDSLTGISGWLADLNYYTGGAGMYYNSGTNTFVCEESISMSLGVSGIIEHLSVASGSLLEGISGYAQLSGFYYGGGPIFALSSGLSGNYLSEGVSGYAVLSGFSYQGGPISGFTSGVSGSALSEGLSGYAMLSGFYYSGGPISGFTSGMSGSALSEGLSGYAEISGFQYVGAPISGFTSGVSGSVILDGISGYAILSGFEYV